MTRARDSVVERCRALAALYVRSRIEGGLVHSNGESKKKWAALERRLATWVRSAKRLSPKERKLFAKRPGTWNEQSQANGRWRLEGLGTLLWSLSLRPSIPAWDRPHDPTKILVLVDTPSWFDAPGRPSPKLELAKLRSEVVLVDAFERFELLHWRSNTSQLPATPKQRRIVADAAAAALKAGFIPRVMSGDFPYRRRAFSKLSEDDASEAHSIAFERHYALSWLLGDDAWDDVETDT